MEGIPFKEGIFTWPEAPGDPIDLLGTKCTSCGKLFFPKVALCPVCLQEDRLEERKIGRRGKLYTYTVVRVPSPGLKVPYAFGYIDLDEGIRVCSQIATAEFDKMKVGMGMELILGQVRDEGGKPIMGYQYRPVKS